MEEPVSGGESERGDVSPEPEPAPRARLWRPAFDRERGRRRALLRRLAAMLGTGTLAFTLTTWLLLRHESRSPHPGASVAATAKADEKPRDSAPAGEDSAEAAALRTARAQLEALNQDDVGAAYSHFSPRYRARVPLATFRRLIKAHRDMFHTEVQEVKTRSQSADRVVLEIHVSSDDGEDYVAQFTLVRLQGRWSVDDLRWGFDEDDARTSA